MRETPPDTNYGANARVSMPDRRVSSGFSGRNGAGVSVADAERGFMRVDADVPSKTRTYEGLDGEKRTTENYERMDYSPHDRTRQTQLSDAGETVDKYAGGFLPRAPLNPNER